MAVPQRRRATKHWASKQMATHISESHGGGCELEWVRARDSAIAKYDVGKRPRGFSGPRGGPGALRPWRGSSPPPRWCNRLAGNVTKWRPWWPAGSRSSPPWARSRPHGRRGRAGGARPASPAAGRREAPRSCTSCCRGAPCLCCCGGGRHGEDHVSATRALGPAATPTKGEGGKLQRHLPTFLAL